ncbi:MAG: lysoplasmalogenase [Phycisphaerae bacterium]|nr:lysoplasmalogenase [Phycisphaerae bacterium]
MAATILVCAIALTTAVTIVTNYRDAKTLHYVAKPLTTILIIVLAAVGRDVGGLYQLLIIAGLVFSLAGDVFLMLPEKPRGFFMPGLVVFLIAHLFYIVAFCLGGGWSNRDVLVALPFVAFGIGTAAYLWPKLGPMKIPVAFYITVILVMGWRSGVRIYAVDVPTPGATIAFVGAILFILSDLILALNRFVRPFASARATNLTSYFAGQACIALSLHM